ncbi:MAG: 3-dehydroquinate synthase [Anaerolineales bacterium]|nr:3-dehydroquinate synthase [Anaerolineales bacterium]
MNPLSSGRNLPKPETGSGKQNSIAGVPVVNPGNIVLAGPSGSGKSTVGQALAEALSRPFLSIDEIIVRRAGMSIEKIFAQQGEAAFRQMEVQVCKETAALTGHVIACGGGALLDKNNREAFEAGGTIVMLHCETGELIQRLQEGGRPLLGSEPAKTLPALLEKRRDHYLSFPNTVDVSGLNVKESVRKLQETAIRASLFHTDVRPDPPSRLLLGEDITGVLDKQLLELGLKSPIVVVCDSNTGPLYGRQIAELLGGSHFSFTAGEQYKTSDTLQQVYDFLYTSRMERQGTIIAVGGGVVGDLTGMAAATWLRGVRWVNVATSLLAMVDSSLGGKVAIDMPYGKNLVGAFYPPALILSDTGVLNTLPEIEFRCGMAELIKTALIGDPLLFSWLEKGGRPSTKWIQRAVQVKARIVKEDPLEKGIRASLNLGHTIGHAIETASNYSVRHGEAVAVGLLLESRLAEKLQLAEAGLSDRINRVLQQWQLPVNLNGASPGLILENMKADKKNVNHQPAFALPVEPGMVKIGIQVPTQLVRDTLAEMQEST